jgi:ABC-type cobalamin/Fe3+-siderophores transport system ATPase subunit
MPVIEVEHLHKQYRGQVAVDDLSFTVERGEIFGVLGPNGAGKTTVVEVIEGLRTPDGGTVRVLGLSPHHAGHLQQPLHRAGRDAAQHLPAPRGAHHRGAAIVCGQPSDQTGQESRSAAPRAAPSMIAMDVTIHASFLPHEDPPAVGQAQSKRSFIARWRSSKPLGARRHRGGGSQCRRADDTTRRSPPGSDQRGEMP